jgi:hypothetical protein
MNGILEELLRLEDAKHRALISLDSNVYEDSVQKQVRLIEDPGLLEAARAGSDKLLAFSRLANINTCLYENLLATAPWIPVASRSYTGQGRIAEPEVTRGFSAEA